ncbi:MAG: hypothetical protein KF798_07010 [Candidatus Paracaedibacteraceae bacterium]|nr:hypothetical protein [Candidatus Paracaedibacteraceae bacterium]
MIIKKKNIILALMCNSCFATDSVGSGKPMTIPPLNLSAVALSADSSLPPALPTSRTLAVHIQQYDTFYVLLKTDTFLKYLMAETHKNSLPSTLFRPDVKGESVTRFFKIIDLAKRQSLISDYSLSEKIEMMQNLLEIFAVIESTSTIFIPKALEFCAKSIKGARDNRDNDRYLVASNCLNGTIENLNNFIIYLDSFGQFIADLMRSQKELFLLVASKGLPETEVTDKESLSNKISQCDFSMERINRKFKEQHSQALALKMLIPEEISKAEEVLEELLRSASTKEAGPSVEASASTPPARRRGLSLLSRNKSKRNVLESGDGIIRGASDDALTSTSSDDQVASSSSPKTPRSRSKTKENTSTKSEY